MRAVVGRQYRKELGNCLCDRVETSASTRKANRCSCPDPITKTLDKCASGKWTVLAHDLAIGSLKKGLEASQKCGTGGSLPYTNAGTASPRNGEARPFQAKPCWSRAAAY